MRYSGIRGYHGYRGRRGGNGKLWLILVLVLILLAAGASLAIQHYIVYDKDGSYHLELPWSRRDAEPDAETPAPAQEQHPHQDLEIVIEQPKAEELARKELHALALDPAVLEGDVTRTLDQLPKNVNAVAVRLKTAEGDLLYPSALPEAAEAKAVAGGEAAGSAVAALTGSEYYTIAQLSALHDSRFALANKVEASVQQKKYKDEVWYGADNTFYLAPEKERTRQYLAALAKEAAALGFDEVLFDEFGYPTAGRLNNIRTADRTLTQEEALALLADELRAALPQEVKLSVWMDEKTVLDGANDKSGQVFADLAARFDRIYVPTTEEGLDALRVVFAGCSAELVPVLAEAPLAGAYLIQR